MRPYQDEEDYWKIRAFLREVFLLNRRVELSWQTARLDYWRWHVSVNVVKKTTFGGDLFIWETADGELAAVLNPEVRGEAFFQVHPGLRTAALDAEMLAVAEERLAVQQADGRRKLRVWAHQQDSERGQMLAAQGYTQGEWPEYQWRRELVGEIPQVQLPEGYVVRSLGGEDELPARSWASWRAFHTYEPDSDYDGWEWYLNFQQSPLYRRDLDIVAVDRDGKVGAFCTVWYGTSTRSGYIRPIGTPPEFRRLGLGRAVLLEGLRRLQRMGGTLATAASFSESANALYSRVMGPDYMLLQPWEKTW